MSTIKRKRDAEYKYAEQENRPGSVTEKSGVLGMSVVESRAPSGAGSGINHVESLLAQARVSGLLPNSGAGSSSKQPNQEVWRDEGGLAGARRLPQYTAYSDPRRQRQRSPQRNAQSGNDPKRRKVDQLGMNKSQQNKPAQNKRKPVPKPGMKAPGALAVDNKYVESLVSEALSRPTGPSAPSSTSLPRFDMIEKSDDYPPPLPPIRDKKLEQRCFTHPSYIHDPINKSKALSSLHYERLEFLGDSYMNYCVTKVLYNRLPDLREGELTRFRSQIISNENIRHYAIMYGFQERILLSAGAVRDEIREAGKKIADIFEAYIGGILTDQPDTGEQTVFQWMKAITAPQVEYAVRIAGSLNDINKNAKQDLYVLIDAERLPAPVYVVTKEGGTNSDFEVACLVQGKEMGRGVGKNKNEAGTRAAMQVLAKLRASTLRKRSADESTDGGNNLRVAGDAASNKGDIAQEDGELEAVAANAREDGDPVETEVNGPAVRMPKRPATDTKAAKFTEEVQMKSQDQMSEAGELSEGEIAISRSESHEP